MHAEQSGLQKVEVGAAIHLAFYELELGDLSLDLTIGPRLGDGRPHGRFVRGDARREG